MTFRSKKSTFKASKMDFGADRLKERTRLKLDHPSTLRSIPRRIIEAKRWYKHSEGISSPRRETINQ
jgi:hypothetical protein